MKTKVQMYKPPEGSGAIDLPVEIFNAKEVVLSYVTTFMRLYGVARITLEPSSVGIKTLTGVSFKPLKGEPPNPYKKSRNYMIRNLADVMILFGVLDIEISPNDDEYKLIEQSWESLKSGKPLTEGQGEEKVKLNLEVDPTGENVLNEQEREEEDVDGPVEADAQPAAESTGEDADSNI